MEPIGFDGRSFREMESHWSGINLFSFVEEGRTFMVSRAHLIYDHDSAPKNELLRPLQAHFGSRCKLVEPEVLSIDDLLHLDLTSPVGIAARPPELIRWDKPEFDLVREIDSVLLALGVKAKAPTTRAFFRGQIISERPG